MSEHTTRVLADPLDPFAVVVVVELLDAVAVELVDPTDAHTVVAASSAVSDARKATSTAAWASTTAWRVATSAAVELAAVELDVVGVVVVAEGDAVSTNGLDPDDAPVVFSAHGVPKAVPAKAAERA